MSAMAFFGRIAFIAFGIGFIRNAGHEGFGPVLAIGIGVACIYAAGASQRG